LNIEFKYSSSKVKIESSESSVESDESVDFVSSSDGAGVTRQVVPVGHVLPPLVISPSAKTAELKRITTKNNLIVDFIVFFSKELF
jgi:hypothetical protein